MQLIFTPLLAESGSGWFGFALMAVLALIVLSAIVSCIKVIKEAEAWLSSDLANTIAFSIAVLT